MKKYLPVTRKQLSEAEDRLMKITANGDTQIYRVVSDLLDYLNLAYGYDKKQKKLVLYKMKGKK